MFRVDVSLLLELGERLISRDEVAVVELVKNSYDADALTVLVNVDKNFITIKDDGCGMDEDDIINGWLTIGTSIKRKNKETAGGRRVLGEKGLGRLATLRLGKLITIITKKHNNPCYKFTMNWKKFRNSIRNNEYVPLSNLQISVEIVKNIFETMHGTYIKVEDLNDVWDEKKISKLQIFLSRLIEPDIDKETLKNKKVTLIKDKFEIKIFYNNKEIIVTPPNVIQNPHYSLYVTIKDDGSYIGYVTYKSYDKVYEETLIGTSLLKTQENYRKEINWNTVKNNGCGGFVFKLYAWDLDAPELKKYKSDLKNWAGISLFRDNFRVVQPEIDWLGLGLRRVQNPTLRLSSNQVIGSVLISSDQNINLIDKTDREGLIDNEAFNIMKDVIYFFMSILERKRQKLRKEQRLTYETLSNYLDTKSIKIVARKLPQDEKKEILDFAKNIDKFKSILNDWILGRDRMATVGMISETILHTGRSGLNQILQNFPIIEPYMEELQKDVREPIERVIEGGKVLAKTFNELDPFLKFRSRKKEHINVYDSIENLLFIFNQTLSNEDIFTENKIDKGIYLNMNPTDIYVLYSNLIDNSIYWLSRKSNDEKKVINIFNDKDDENIILIYKDNGPGIDPENFELIFEAGFTTKPDGSGLGLAIIKNIIDSYNGRINVENDEKDGGAVFRIWLPKKEVMN